jgi:hypothetical protein
VSLQRVISEINKNLKKNPHYCLTCRSRSETLTVLLQMALHLFATMTTL